MDIVSDGVADLEFLDYVPDIAGNPQAMEVIVELLAKLPEVKIAYRWSMICLMMGRLEIWKNG